MFCSAILNCQTLATLSLLLKPSWTLKLFCLFPKDCICLFVFPWIYSCFYRPETSVIIWRTASCGLWVSVLLYKCYCGLSEVLNLSVSNMRAQHYVVTYIKWKHMLSSPRLYLFVFKCYYANKRLCHLIAFIKLLQLIFVQAPAGWTIELIAFNQRACALIMEMQNVTSVVIKL